MRPSSSPTKGLLYELRRSQQSYDTRTMYVNTNDRAQSLVRGIQNDFSTRGRAVSCSTSTFLVTRPQDNLCRLVLSSLCKSLKKGEAYWYITLYASSFTAHPETQALQFSVFVHTQRYLRVHAFSFRFSGMLKMFCAHSSTE